MPKTSRLWVNLLTLGLVACGLGLGLKNLYPSLHGAKPAVTTDTEPVPDPAAPPSGASADDPDLRPLAPGEHAAAEQAPAVLQTLARTGSPVQTEPRLEASPYTRQLVSSLANLDVTHGALTPEQIQSWKENLQTLTNQGAAAVPAIREFLEQNKEVVFGSMGGDQLGQTSMRSALINSLAQISGPEATSALIQTLQTSTLPGEIGQLAQILDQRAPGQYRQETVAAINEVLNMASNGQLPPGWDVGALFKTLQSYGDSSAASALEQLQGPYKYYATMALASLQGGDGVPILVRESQDASAGSRRDFAYQMLAQTAAQYPDAGAALLEQAKANQISDSAWTKIVMGLAGDQYQIGENPPGTAGDPALTPGLKTFHIGSGNQNFYSLPLSANPQLQQRLALVDQLIGATSNPFALSALQAARGSLTALISN